MLAINKLRENPEASIRNQVIKIETLDNEIEALGYVKKAKTLDYELFKDIERFGSEGEQETRLEVLKQTKQDLYSKRMALNTRLKKKLAMKEETQNSFKGENGELQPGMQ